MKKAEGRERSESQSTLNPSTQVLELEMVEDAGNLRSAEINGDTWILAPMREPL